jgi:HEAT repeat protein
MTRAVRAVVVLMAGVSWLVSGRLLAPRVAAQATFEGVIADLGSRDGGTRLKAVRLLKGAGYPEAAIPLSRAVLDPFDEIQLEAIGAELNIFLAERVTPRRRVGLLVEVRNQIAAEPIFSAGPTAVGALRVPAEVLTALAHASRDPNARVAVEALYAFGVLAGEAATADRPAILSQSGPILAASIGATDPALRLAAIKVIGRVFARRAGDPPIDESVGDAVILALNDRESVIQQTAMWALGLLRYERAVQGLNQLFQYHQRGPMATAAFDALARIGHPSTLTQLVTLLNGRDTALKVIAIEGLARMGDRARNDTIQLALRDERNDAVLLAGHFANVRLAGGTAEAIVESLSRGRLRVQALDYLFEIAPGRASVLARQLQDPDPRVRLDIVETLGLAGDPAALAIVAPLTSDKDPELARAAARAVARLGTDRAS